MSLKKYYLLIFEIAVLLVVSACFALAWEEPACGPPGCNVDAPVNVGISTQSKSGTLGAEAFIDASDPAPGTWYVDPYGAGGISALFRQNVGIGTTDVSNYILRVASAGAAGSVVIDSFIDMNKIASAQNLNVDTIAGQVKLQETICTADGSACSTGAECCNNFCIAGACRSGCALAYSGQMCSPDASLYDNYGICARDAAGTWSCDTFEAAASGATYYIDCDQTGDVFCDSNSLAGGYVGDGRCSGADCCTNIYAQNGCDCINNDGTWCDSSPATGDFNGICVNQATNQCETGDVCRTAVGGLYYSTMVACGNNTECDTNVFSGGNGFVRDGYVCGNSCFIDGSRNLLQSCCWDVNCDSGLQCSGGQCKYPNGTACTAGNECASGRCYVDADGDRYSPAAGGTMTCQASSMLGAVGDDCYDNNVNARPGQTSSYGFDRGDGSFDYNCDGSEEEQIYTCYDCTVCFMSGTCGDTTCGIGLGQTISWTCSDSPLATCGQTWNRTFCFGLAWFDSPLVGGTCNWLFPAKYTGTGVENLCGAPLYGVDSFGPATEAVTCACR